MATTSALRELGRLRLAAQRLVGEPLATPVEAVRWMTCSQGQDLPGALASVALRTASRSTDDVVAAMDAGEVVRSWPMRGTLHLLDPADLRWMLAVTTPRLLQQWRRVHEQAGIDQAVVDRARAVAVGLLSGGRRASRAQLRDALQEAGIEVRGLSTSHLVLLLAQTGLVVIGPMDGGVPQFVLLDEWVPAAAERDRGEAVAHWVERYLRSHGPTTLKDFCWWTKVTLTEAKPALAAVRDRLERYELDGVEMFMDPATPDRLAAARSAADGVLLLPGFDEFVLGYGDRDPVLPREHAVQVCPGNNGMFQPSVVSGGRLVGTWKRRSRGASGPVDATPFTTFPAAVQRALPRASAGLPA